MPISITIIHNLNLTAQQPAISCFWRCHDLEIQPQLPELVRNSNAQWRLLTCKVAMFNSSHKFLKHAYQSHEKICLFTILFRHRTTHVWTWTENLENTTLPFWCPCDLEICPRTVIWYRSVKLNECAGTTQNMTDTIYKQSFVPTAVTQFFKQQVKKVMPVPSTIKKYFWGQNAATQMAGVTALD